MKLRISDKLGLPDDAVTSTIVVYGGKGMGKTNFGSVLAEELARCRLRWAWLDPLGVSWGLRHSSDGKGDGVECLILGGVHGDVPIEPAGGEAVADVVIEERVNVLIDFSRTPAGKVWPTADKIRFVTDYSRRLFERQGDLVAGRKRQPLFLVLDEAARFVPQTIPAGNKHLSECLAVWQQLVEEGRNFSLGVGLISQRSARLNKDVSELADAMFAFRTIGPNSLGAVLDWLGDKVDKKHLGELSRTVRKLPVGSALVVSPGWLDFEGVVQIRPRETFDSSATQKAGRPSIAIEGEGAKPDLDKIRVRMTATIENAKANDPKELKKRIAELEAKMAAPVAGQVDEGQVRARIAAAVLEERKDCEQRLASLVRKCGDLEMQLEEEWQLLAKIHEVSAPFDRPARVSRTVEAPKPMQPPPERMATPAPAAAARESGAPATDAAGLKGGALRIVKTLANSFPASFTEGQVCSLVEMTIGGGAWSFAKKAAVASGLIEIGSDKLWRATQRAVAEYGDPSNRPCTPEQAVERWKKVLGPGPATLIDVALEKGRNGISREDLAEFCGLASSGGAFGGHLSKLVNNGLLEKHGRFYRVTELLTRI